MPCWNTMKVPEIATASKALDKLLESQKVTVTIGAQGAVAFKGWNAANGRGKMSDVCAYRKLMASGSFALKKAVQRAEALSGRKVSAVAVAAGTHSHDGGDTWNEGH